MARAKSIPTPPELSALVAEMRRLGVTKCGDVELGQAPGPEPRSPTKEEVAARIKKEQDQRDAVLFAATSVRPRRK